MAGILCLHNRHDKVSDMVAFLSLYVAGGGDLSIAVQEGKGAHLPPFLKSK